MNFKKVMATVLAGASVAAMVSAASAVELGASEETIVVTPDAETEGTVILEDNVALSFTLPAGIVDEETTIEFSAEEVESELASDLISAAVETFDFEVKDAVVMDLVFFKINDDGTKTELDFSDIDMKMDNADFDRLFVENEDGSISEVALAEDGSFKAPHFSNYIFVKTASDTTDDSNDTSDDTNDNSTATPATNTGDGKAVSTGDNATLPIVCGCVAIVALAAVVFAAKAKKSVK